MPKRFLWFRSTLLATVSLAIALKPGLAQSAFPDCQPPKAGEFLLLIVTQTAETQAQARRTLPSEVTATVCNYLNTIVTRIGGFATVEAANSWANYMTDVVGLPAFVARPSSTAARPVTPTPTLPNTTGYSPQSLGPGFAVLVDYNNRPEVATQIRLLLEREIGLVSYGQRPYLLALYTNSQEMANATLRRLSDRGYLSLVVDSRKVVLLRSVVGR